MRRPICTTCDWHGPELGDTLEAQARAFHRLLHWPFRLLREHRQSDYALQA